MPLGMDTEYFAQHIQCTRDDKQDCLPLVRQLVELAFAARENGVLKMDELIQNQARYPDPFLRKAVHLVIETSKQENIRKVLYNYIFSSRYVAGQRFLSSVLITETMLAISRAESLEYVFTYLVPSYFGIDYEKAVVDIYRNYKQARLKAILAEAEKQESVSSRSVSGEAEKR